MTGKFSIKDEVRCAHYARFFKDLTLPEANVIYWFLFTFVLLLLCTSSIQHHKSNNLTEMLKELGKPSPSQIRRVRRRRIHYLSLVALCFLLALMCVIFEVFAIFNIQYCDGEDLIQLYWGFWSVIQVGCLIAILGVMLQFWIVLGNVQTPSWAVALGTPVLVFAAFGYIFRHIFLGWRMRKKNNIYDTDVEEGRRPGTGDEDNKETGDKNEEKLGSWAERLLSWAPKRRNREARDLEMNRLGTSRSTGPPLVEFVSRGTTIYTPGKPGDIYRTSTS